MTNSTLPRWLRKKQAAELLGVHPNTIDNLRQRMKPNSKRPILRSRRSTVGRGIGGAHVLISTADVLALKAELDEVTSAADAITDNGRNDPAEINGGAA